MPTSTINLTQSNFRIFISTPSRVLDDIFFESVTGLGKTSQPIRTSNGVKKYYIPTKAEVSEITLSKSANPDEDPIIVRWINDFCSDVPIIDGSVSSESVLMVVPLRPCAADELYNVACKGFNIIPTGWSGWDADILNTTDTSRFTVTCIATEVEIS